MEDKSFIYCTDCQCYTNQKYRGIRFGDNTPYYICEICACENDNGDNALWDDYYEQRSIKS